jgi:hypothetical protein
LGKANCYGAGDYYFAIPSFLNESTVVFSESMGDFSKTLVWKKQTQLGVK